MKTFTLPSHSIAVYTVLRVLCCMRARLGLEAMLEYVGRYILLVEKNNQEMKDAVTKALGLIDIAVLYKEAIHHG